MCHNEYQIILLGDRGTCVNNLFKVVTGKCNSRDLNVQRFVLQVQCPVTLSIRIQYWPRGGDALWLGN